VRGLSLRFGSRQIFDNLTFTIPEDSGYRCWGQRCRKSSLLRIIAGLAKATAGEVRASDGQPIDTRLAWMGQKDLLYPWLSVHDNVSLGARLRGSA
jgi:putative hydroxymethylpyrimidine transport system ATP-binding protein